MRKIYIANLADIAYGQMHCREVGGETVLIANTDAGLHAIGGQCTHESASLCKGALKGNNVMCPLHGSLFDITTGEPDGDPADIPVKCYKIEIIGGDVYLLL